MTPTASQDPPIPQGGGGLMLWPWPWQGGWGGDPEPGTYMQPPWSHCDIAMKQIRMVLPYFFPLPQLNQRMIPDTPLLSQKIIWELAKLVRDTISYCNRGSQWTNISTECHHFLIEALWWRPQTSIFGKTIHTQFFITVINIWYREWYIYIV